MYITVPRPCYLLSLSPNLQSLFAPAVGWNSREHLNKGETILNAFVGQKTSSSDFVFGLLDCLSREGNTNKNKPVVRENEIRKTSPYLYRTYKYIADRCWFFLVFLLLADVYWKKRHTDTFLPFNSHCLLTEKKSYDL